MSESILTSTTGLPRFDLMRRMLKKYRFYPVRHYAFLIGESLAWTEGYLRKLEADHKVAFRVGKTGNEVKLTVEGRLRTDGTLPWKEWIMYQLGLL